MSVVGVQLSTYHVEDVGVVEPALSFQYSSYITQHFINSLQWVMYQKKSSSSSMCLRMKDSLPPEATFKFNPNGHKRKQIRAPLSP